MRVYLASLAGKRSTKLRYNFYCWLTLVSDNVFADLLSHLPRLETANDLLLTNLKNEWVSSNFDQSLLSAQQAVLARQISTRYLLTRVRAGYQQSSYSYRCEDYSILILGIHCSAVMACWEWRQCGNCHCRNMPHMEKYLIWRPLTLSSITLSLA